MACFRRNVAMAACLLLGGWGAAAAETLEVRVLDVNGVPVSGVAVFVEEQGAARRPGAPRAATMDQRDLAFVPHVLIVQTGARVEFPNSDVFAHHVYSFSRPNQFALPLYKGTPPEPVLFEHPGIVTLGCNIHDGMLGYILVVDTDLFAMTDEQGLVRFDVAADAKGWTASIWSPRIRDSRKPLTQTVKAGGDPSVTFALSKKLGPEHTSHSESVEWDSYD